MLIGNYFRKEPGLVSKNTSWDLIIGFLVKNYVYFTPGMYGKPPKIRFDHGFSKAGFGHASLFLKNPCRGQSRPRWNSFEVPFGLGTL